MGLLQHRASCFSLFTDETYKSLTTRQPPPHKPLLARVHHSFPATWPIKCFLVKYEVVRETDKQIWKPYQLFLFLLIWLGVVWQCLEGDCLEWNDEKRKIALGWQVFMWRRRTISLQNDCGDALQPCWSPKKPFVFCRICCSFQNNLRQGGFVFKEPSLLA